MDINEALISFFDKKGRNTLYNFVTTHTSLVENYIRQFSKAADARKNLVSKFKSEYKIKNPRSKRSPAITFDFDTLWSSTQVNKTLISERDKVSDALIKASSVEITKKLQVPVAEEEEGENQNTAYMSNNSEQTLREEDSDDREPNSVNEDDGYSNERSDNASDENLVYILDINEDKFTSIISSDGEVPAYLKQFELFQLKAFNKAKTVGLFVNADLYQILSLYHIILLKKGRAYPDINMDDLYKQMLEFHKCDANIDKKTFDAIAEAFRGIGDVPDRDELKIKLFKIYEEAEKEDRKVIDVLINLCVVYTQLNKLPNEETIDYKVEEQELINNFADPILSPLLHRPEKDKLFLWLDRMVTKTYNTRPDAGCAIIHERRIERFSCFAEVKAEYKKKDTLSTHQDLLRLALFGMNKIEDNDAKCILLVQVIGAVITYYGCTEHTNGPKIIFEISKIKIPLSMQDLPGFIMKLDDLQNSVNSTIVTAS